MLEYNSIKQLVDMAQKTGKNISDLVLADQKEEMDTSETDLLHKMSENLKVMKESIDSGLGSPMRSVSGLSGYNACLYQRASNEGKIIGGSILNGIISKALAVAEVNACMGRIVAAPTAGSSGILPAVIITLMEELGIPEIKAVMGLFTAAGIGMVIAKQASISGAEGGCQAECGSASAMAAAAMVEMLGGSPEMAANACAMALKNVLGMVCDPVAGLVEIPCVKRNAAGAVNAIVAANMAISGIESVIPVDEVIGAMRSVGNLIPTSLKETAEGGLAATPTGRRLAKAIFGC